MEADSSVQRAAVITAHGLRRAIGAIGCALPLVLALGTMASDGSGIESSISTYYHTGMRDLFVGAMCAIGILFFAYHGYDQRDEIAAKVGSLSAIGLALVPTAPDVTQRPAELLLGQLHLLFAAVFFLTLAYFSLYLFTQSHPHRVPPPQKVQRNRIYRLCGFLIAVTLLSIAVVKQLPQNSSLLQYDPMFWLESIAVEAFGLSWLTKGEVFLKDAPARGELPLPQRR